jgi:hypothetical protein
VAFHTTPLQNFGVDQCVRMRISQPPLLLSEVTAYVQIDGARGRLIKYCTFYNKTPELFNWDVLMPKNIRWKACQTHERLARLSPFHGFKAPQHFGTSLL